MIITRYDNGSINDKHITAEGFLSVDATVTRTGVFNYRNNDGSVRRELRHPDDVLNEDSLQSMKLLPVTLLHPKAKIVNKRNFTKVAVGFTGENVNHDGRLIKTNVKITDEKAIEAIQNKGVDELSLGYSVTLIKEDGEFNGQRYDHRQTNIKYNHLALVPLGRAGHEAKLHLDAEDAVQITDEEIDSININKKKETDMNLVKVDLGGCSYDAAPEVKIALDSALEANKSSTKEVETLKADKDTIQANLDTANETIEASKKVDTTDVINKAVKARTSLEREAVKHLDAEVKLDEMSDMDIKKACIIKHFPNSESKVNADDVTDTYINARFDSVLEIELKEDGDHKEETKKVGVGAQREKMKIKTDSKDKRTRVDSEASRDAMIERLTNPNKSES